MFPHLSSVVSPTQWAWQKNPSPITLKVLTTYTHTHTYRSPPDHSGQTQHIYLWIKKKKKYTSEILIVQQEQIKIHKQPPATSDSDNI